MRGGGRFTGVTRTPGSGRPRDPSHGRAPPAGSLLPAGGGGQGPGWVRIGAGGAEGWAWAREAPRHRPRRGLQAPRSRGMARGATVGRRAGAAGGMQALRWAEAWSSFTGETRGAPSGAPGASDPLETFVSACLATRSSLESRRTVCCLAVCCRLLSCPVESVVCVLT